VIHYCPNCSQVKSEFVKLKKKRSKSYEHILTWTPRKS
jgi:hypothetical protein